MHEADKTVTKKMGEAENKFGQFKSDSAAEFEAKRKEANKAIDKFDQTVEKKTADAKSGLSSWFGFGK